jgi:hypothetical protein
MGAVARDRERAQWNVIAIAKTGKRRRARALLERCVFLTDCFTSSSCASAMSAPSSRITPDGAGGASG